MRYRFIEAEKANYPVRILCRVMRVSRSAYYDWLKREPDIERLILMKLVIEIFESSGRTYGARRIAHAATQRGVPLGRMMVASLMLSAGIRAIYKKRFRITTDSGHELETCPNHLGREFDVEKTDTIWCGDITYLLTREGWVYLAVVIDLASRKVVGWSISNRMKKSLVIDALRAAFTSRRPEKGLMFHSDRGSQYASDDFKHLIKLYGMTQSMSRKGNCWDNAVVERFFRSLKTERTNEKIYATREEIRKEVFDYIEVFYNRSRLHSTLGYLSPEQFEMQSASL